MLSSFFVDVSFHSYRADDLHVCFALESKLPVTIDVRVCKYHIKTAFFGHALVYPKRQE